MPKNKRRPTNKANKTVQASTPSGFFAKRAASRALKKEARLATKKEQANQKAARHMADQKQAEKAKQEAIKTKALQQVEQAVNKSSKRRSHPLPTLLLLLITIALSGALVWQYRQTEIDEKNDQISALELAASSFSDQVAQAEAEAKAEAARFQIIPVGEASIRLPSTWTKQTTQYPIEETVYGDSNVTLRIVNSQSRNSIEQFLPSLDYIWQIQDSNQGLRVVSQSLHCERFDTLNNDLKNQLREHLGFNVYCDTSSEQIVIGVFFDPTSYSTPATGVYFLIEVNDAQQFDLNQLSELVASYTRN